VVDIEEMPEMEAESTLTSQGGGEEPLIIILSASFNPFAITTLLNAFPE